jgi:hypothetical protein
MSSRIWCSSVAAFHPLQERAQPIGVLGAHHQIQFGNAPQQGFPLLLGHTSGHHQNQMGIGPFADRLAAQIAVHLLLRAVADGAGVVHDQVGTVLILARGVAPRFQDAGHALGIRLVHLAAEGGDPVAAAWRAGGGSGGRGCRGRGPGRVSRRHGTSFGYGGRGGGGSADLVSAWP